VERLVGRRWAARVAAALGIALALGRGLGIAEAVEASAAADETESSAGPAADRIEVDRVEPSSEKPKSLRFLSENRVFLRAQLDQLRQLARRGSATIADPLDPRFLKYRELLAEVRASADSQSAADDRIARRDLLASVAELAEIEAQVDSAEALLARQGERLSWLESDFAGRQETALVILVRGVPPCGAPEAILIREANGDDVRVALSDAARGALAAGGIAQALHAFVEPREHAYEVSLEGGACAARAPVTVTVEPERDRLTFLELDLSATGPEAAPVRAVAWVR